jgi:YggT family protein
MPYYLAYKLFDFTFQGLYIALLIRTLLSWFRHDPYHPIVNVIYRITEPILEPFRNIIPSMRYGIDLSPLFAFLALGIVRKLLFQLMF